jgi:DNA-binding CsgD family transcriptional regulator
MAEDFEQEVSSRGRKSVSWRRDPLIQQRMRQVERLHLSGHPNTEIAIQLHVTEATIRNDLKRLQENWAEHLAQDQAALRAEVVAKIEDARLRALAAAEFDEQNERAVLYGVEVEIDGERHRVYRDAKESAQYRGQKAQALNVARQAAMDEAKVLGLVVDKQEQSGEVLVRIYERGR